MRAGMLCSENETVVRDGSETESENASPQSQKLQRLAMTFAGRCMAEMELVKCTKRK